MSNINPASSPVSPRSNSVLPQGAATAVSGQSAQAITSLTPNSDHLAARAERFGFSSSAASTTLTQQPVTQQPAFQPTVPQSTVTQSTEFYPAPSSFGKYTGW